MRTSGGGHWSGGARGRPRAADIVTESNRRVCVFYSRVVCLRLKSNLVLYIVEGAGEAWGYMAL